MKHINYSFPESTTELIQKEVELQGQVLVKIKMYGKSVDVHQGKLVTKINISKDTYLYPDNSEQKVKMLTCFGIPHPPNYTLIQVDEFIIFYLLFNGLPKNCQKFHIVEENEDTHRFFFKYVPRRQLDVYWILME